MQRLLPAGARASRDPGQGPHEEASSSGRGKDIDEAGVGRPKDSSGPQQQHGADGDQGGWWRQVPAGGPRGPVALPTAMDGLNWWCYTVLALIFITDFTPFGPLLLQGRNAGAYLAVMQWALFVLPTLNWCREQKWDLAEVFRLRGCAPKWIAAALAVGPLLWAATALAVMARTGASLGQLSGAAAAAAGGVAAGASPVTGVLFGELLQRPDDPAQWASVLATSALSPAVAEELLYRGFLLTAMLQRFGRVDAAAICAALFSASHLSIPQFFAFTLLGGACGGLTLAADSVLPALVAHAAYNATGLGVGLAVALAGGAGAQG